MISEIMKFSNCILVFFIFENFLNLSAFAAGKEIVVWTREIQLSDNFVVKFNNDDPEKLIMEISAPTKGYVAVGFSPNGAMKGSDIILGWVTSDGQAFLEDMYAVGNSEPLRDKTNDLELLWATEDEYGTTLRFARPYVTCDYDHDFEINDDTVRLIWAIGNEDPIIHSNGHFSPAYHKMNRGVRSLFLKSRTHLLKFPDDDPNPDPHIKYWDVKMQETIVPDTSDTTYYCKIIKAPMYEEKHQILGFRVLLDEPNKRWVHHINFFECNVPDSHGPAEAIFEKYLNHPPGHCYTKNMPPEWGQYCMTVPFVWVAGAEGIMFNEGGIPLDKNKFFMLEIHYDNPFYKRFKDSSGVRIFLTDKPKPNDIGGLVIRTRISHGFHLLPPGYNGWKNVGFCTSECTEKALPEEGITVTHATLHGHLTMRKLRIRHIRNGKELPPIAEDNHYDFDYQQSRVVNPPRKIYRGDVLLTECEFDTSARKNITYGGTGTRDEMCEGYIYFYPRIPLSNCKVQYDFYNFFDAVGISQVNGNDVLERVSLPYHPKPNQLYDPGDDTCWVKQA